MKPNFARLRLDYKADPKDFPVACEIGDRTLSLPLWVDLTDAMGQEVVTALRAVAIEVGRA